MITQAALLSVLLLAGASQDAPDTWAALQQESQRVNALITSADRASLSPDDRPMVEALLERTRAFTTEHPDHYDAWELQGQIGLTLEDPETIDEAFARLVELDPSMKQTALLWPKYYAETDLARAVEIMDILIDGTPSALMYHEVRIRMLDDLEGDSVDARLESLISQPDGHVEAGGMLDALSRRDAFAALGWADRLSARWPEAAQVVASAARAYRGANEFSRARQLIQSIDPAQLTDPTHRYLFSDTWYADNHFDEAYTWMSSIDMNALKHARPGMHRRLEVLLPLRDRAREAWAMEQASRLEDARRDDNPLARLIINEQEVVVELFEDTAPNAVANFIASAELGLYEGREAGWVHTGFRTIMGDRHVDDSLPYWSLPDVDPSAMRPFLPGTLACYSEAQPDSVNSTFFVMHFPAPHLDGIRVSFGRVVSGLDVIREMRQGDLLERIEIIRQRDHPYDPEVVDVTGRRLLLSELLSEDHPPPEGERTSSGALVRRRHCRHSTQPFAGPQQADRP